MQSNNCIHYAPKYFIDPTHPISIAVIGCGGTGSLLLPRLARLDFALRQFNRPGIFVVAYDGDIVESHNQGRQNFVESDVQTYKASTMIEKINMAFGLQWEAVNKYVKGDKLPKANIIITCVDNAKFRLEVDYFFKTQIRSHEYDYAKRYYWMDTGNGKDFGQVILSTIHHIDQPQVNDFTTVDVLPSVIDIFGDILKDDTKELQGMESCSFAESIQQQDLFINDSISTAAAKMLWRLLKDFFITTNGVMINQSTYQERGLPLKVYQQNAVK